MPLKSTHPYLLRAIYDWALDNGYTPHLLVEVEDEKTQVPRELVEDGRLILNIAPRAVRGLEIGEEFVSFNARFGGVARDIFVPVTAVRAIYAKENGRGIVLPQGETDSETPATAKVELKTTASKPDLKVVK